MHILKEAFSCVHVSSTAVIILEMKKTKKMAQVYFPLTFTVHDVRLFPIYRVVLSVVCGDAPDVSMETW